MRRLLCLVICLAMTAGGVLAVASSASAGPRTSVACGATITTNTTLHRDLINCPNRGIVIGADNISLDLNGHRIDGNESLVEDCPAGIPCDVGIYNMGHRGLSIKGGSITDFGWGIILYKADKGSLRHLSVERSYYSGVVAVESAHLKAEGNSITRNGLEPGFAGMVADGVTDALIMKNRLAGNGDQGLSAVGSNRIRIVGNTFSGRTESGMNVVGNGNDVSDNRIVGGGIILAGSDNRLSRNYVADPPRCGDGCGVGISFEMGMRNVIERNVVVRAPIVGIRVEAYDLVPAVSNTVRNNIVRDGDGDGISINPDGGPVSSTLVESNVVTGSGDDGIDVASPTTTVRRNVAAHNGDLGIEVVTGVTDGGGNRAFANGNPLQCTNISC